jgi:predicted aconitase/predicted aconitase with swiveling domain
MRNLTAYDRSLLAGERGPGSQMAMRIVVRMAEVFDAVELLDITASHIDSTIFMGDATLEYAERLADLGATVAVPATSNVSGVDEHGWREWPVPPAWAAKARRQMDAYRRMGVTASFTCAPYQTELRPAFGQQVAWGESNAIAFANTVLGARTERYPDLLDICAAITGRVPAVGLHLTANRAGQLLIRLESVPPGLQADDSFYPVLGHLTGKLAGDRIPVLEGLAVEPTEDQLKALCAAAATSGAVALCHIVGVTPEAPTLDAAFQGRAPGMTYVVGLAELRAARAELTTATGETPDLVLLGSPHFSLAEFRQLAPLLDGQTRHPTVRLLVTTSRAVAALAEYAGLLTPFRDFGGQLTVDTCPLATPMLPPEIRTLMTNSAKYAYYAPGLLDTQVIYGSLADCVRSAVAGRVERDETPWELHADAVILNGSTAQRESGRTPGEGSLRDKRDPALESDLHQGHGVDPLRVTADTNFASELRGRAVVSGEAKGQLLFSDAPLSFWGGYDAATGEIIDRRHPLSGQIAAGRVLAIPFTKGSSTTTAVFLEAVRAGTAPAAILTAGTDAFLALASIVADELYGRPVPVVALTPEDFAMLGNAEDAEVQANGYIRLG